MANVENLFTSLTNIIYPKHCFGCGKSGYYICPTCEGKIEYLTEPVCIGCGRPSMRGFTHSYCNSPLRPNRLISAYKYSNVIKTALVKAKYYSQVFDVYKFLVDTGFDYFNEIGLDMGSQALFVPIPIYWKKYLKRTFNHAEILAQLLAKKYNSQVCDCLQKVTFTKTQSLLGKEDRAKNIKGAFKVKSAYESTIKGKDIVLVDDICTTGATLLEACKTLKQTKNNAPRFIYCLTLAYDIKR